MRLARRLRFYFLFALDLAASRLGRLRAPFKYIVVVTKACDSRCRNCLIWTENPRDELRLVDYEEIARKSPNLKWLNLTGGEVTLRADVVDIVRAFKRFCPDLEMLNFTTDGIDSDRILHVARQLGRLDFLKITINVSLDGPRATHDQLRGRAGNFDSALRTFQGLRKIEGVDSRLSFTIYDANVDRFDEMVREVSSLDPSISVADFHLNLENRSEHFYGHRGLDQERKRQDDKLRLLRSANRAMLAKSRLNLETYFRFMYQAYAKIFLMSGRTPLRCQALASSAYISEKGDVFPCVVWSEKVGSLRETGFELSPILNSTRALDLRKKIERRQCANCWTPCEAYTAMMTRPFGF